MSLQHLSVGSFKIPLSQRIIRLYGIEYHDHKYAIEKQSELALWYQNLYLYRPL